MRHPRNDCAVKTSAKRRVTVVFAIALMLLGGCAGKQPVPAFVGIEPAPPGKAVVYHYRLTSFSGGAVNHHVLSNDVPMTSIGNGGYFREVVDPGPRTYRSKMNREAGWFITLAVIAPVANQFEDFDERYQLQVEPDGTYFVRWSWKDAKQSSRADAERNLPRLTELAPTKFR